MLIKVDEAPQCWSYMAVDYHSSPTNTDPARCVQVSFLSQDVDFHRSLMELGDQGWELVSLVPILVGDKTILKAVFKQPLSVVPAASEAKTYTIPIGRLKEELEGYPDDFEVIFGNRPVCAIHPSR